MQAVVRLRMHALLFHPLSRIGAMPQLDVRRIDVGERRRNPARLPVVHANPLRGRRRNLGGVHHRLAEVVVEVFPAAGEPQGLFLEHALLG